MNRNTVAAYGCAAILAVLTMAGCSSTPDTDNGDLGVPPAQQSVTTTVPGPSAGIGDDAGTADTPSPIVGRTAAAVASVARAFVVNFGAFSPFNFDPAQDWLNSWQDYADPAFIGQMQTSLVSVWGWTWQQQVKAYDVHLVGAPTVKITGDVATVRVNTNRLILGINDTADRAREQDLTYVLQLELRDDDEYALVTEATEAPAGA